MIPKEDKELLEQLRPTLMQSITLETGTLFAHLRAQGLITQDTEDVVKCDKGNANQVGRLLDFLLRGDPETVPKFILALEDSEHSDIAKICRERRSSKNTADDRTDSADVSAPTTTPLDFLKGGSLTLVKTSGCQAIEWKQGSFMGIGGDKNESYQKCDYKISGGDKLVPVYIHIDKGGPPKSLKADRRMQYGMNNGILFMVWHDKTKFKPYQHRFVRNDLQKGLYVANDIMPGYDFGWAVGDYLRDFQ